MECSCCSSSTTEARSWRRSCSKCAVRSSKSCESCSASVRKAPFSACKAATLSTTAKEDACNDRCMKASTSERSCSFSRRTSRNCASGTHAAPRARPDPLPPGRRAPPAPVPPGAALVWRPRRWVCRGPVRTRAARQPQDAQHGSRPGRIVVGSAGAALGSGARGECRCAKLGPQASCPLEGERDCSRGHPADGRKGGRLGSPGPRAPCGGPRGFAGGDGGARLSRDFGPGRSLGRRAM
mmetsp:Transcript_117625/g.366422  ORF Transcript_117625/g.366422 Transcript_117625/m.366422 type:complete len:239 (+) Transcript_117625:121-837(+)